MTPEANTKGTAPMGLVPVSDGMGGTKHVFAPLPASTKKGGKKSKPAPADIHANPDAAAQQLRLFIERMERLIEEKKGIADDIKDVGSEAKSQGYSVKAIKAIITLRSMDPHDRMEDEAILDTYKSALGLA